MTFEQKINEDLRGVFARLGKMRSAKKARDKENARHLFWAFMGDAKEAGRYDINKMEEYLYRLFANYMGRMDYERTAKAFLDFVQVLKGESEIPLPTMMAALRGTPNIKKNSPNSKLIKTIFNKMLADKLPEDKVIPAVEKLDDLARANTEDKGLIFEYMRLVSQQKPELLNNPDYAKLVPYLDRYLTSSETSKMMRTLAQTLMRSQTVQELTGSSTQPSQSTQSSQNDTPSSNTDKSEGKGQRIARAVYIRNLEKLLFPEDIHRMFREKANDDFWDQRAEPFLESRYSDHSRLNKIAANVFSLMVAWNNISEDRLVTVLHNAELAMTLNKIKNEDIRQMRVRVMRGETPEQLAGEFDALYDTKTEAVRWLIAILRVEHLFWAEKNKKSNENS